MFSRRSTLRRTSAHDAELDELRRRVKELEAMLERVTSSSAFVVDVRSGEASAKTPSYRSSSSFAEAWSHSDVVFATDANDFFSGTTTDERARRWLLSTTVDRDVA